MKYLFYSVIAICITLIACFGIAYLDAETIKTITFFIVGGFVAYCFLKD